MMSLNNIIKNIKSSIGLILFGQCNASGTISNFNKKITPREYKIFLRRTTLDVWDELTKPSFVDGFINDGPTSNTKIYCDLNDNDEIPIKLLQKKEEFEFWIKFEQKGEFIENVLISTGDNSTIVIYNTVVTFFLIATQISFDINLFLVLGLISLMRLYTFLSIRNSITFITLHLEYMFKIYSIKMNRE